MPARGLYVLLMFFSLFRVNIFSDRTSHLVISESIGQIFTEFSGVIVQWEGFIVNYFTKYRGHGTLTIPLEGSGGASSVKSPGPSKVLKMFARS